ncbi:15122_t:CDS:10, partial [Entrophospora sp. SA101]
MSPRKIHVSSNSQDFHTKNNLVFNRKILLAQYQAGIAPETYRQGLLKCNEINREKLDNSKLVRTKNPRYTGASKTILLKNALILDGVSDDAIESDLLMQDGIIKSISRDEISNYLKKMKETQQKFNDDEIIIINLKRKYVSPDSWPYLNSNRDYNEWNEMITPYVRAKDGLNPNDPAIRIVASGGVTTSLVLPGSSNVMGGEGYVIKMRLVDTLSVDDMSINANINPEEEHKWRWLKMTCGESPKHDYGGKRYAPRTRMGIAWLFRRSFSEALKIKQSQDNWCNSARRLGGSEQLSTNFPEDLKYESLIALLRGDAKLNVHCYEVEFNFTIAAIHHASDAYRIPEIIKRGNGNITVALFSDLWGSKKESFGGSTKGPKILADNNILVSLISNHPVINAQTFVFEAAKAHYYGLSKSLSIAAITSVPANSLGLGHRIGQVYIDGIPQFDASISLLENSTTKNLTENKKINNHQITNDDKVKSRTVSSIIIKNIGKVFINQDYIIDSTNLLRNETINIIIKDGIVDCIGSDCKDPEEISLFEIVDLCGGYVLPGITAVGSDLGLREIMQEESTSDGEVEFSGNPNEIIYALDGLKLGGKHLDVAYKAGIFNVITSPISTKGLISGVSVAFKTGASKIIDKEAIIKEATALHVHIGSKHKSKYLPTISSQISTLRKLLLLFRNNNDVDDIFKYIINGKIPLVAEVDNKDEISALIKLKKHIKAHGGDINLVILGGSESHLVAKELYEENVSVILRPTRPTPNTWSTKDVLIGKPITNRTCIEILHEHKVKIGIGVSDSSLARNLVWDAGWVFKNSNGLFKEKEINTRKNGLINGNAASFVAYDGNPFSMDAK